MIESPARPSYVDDDDPAFAEPLLFDAEGGLLIALEQEIRRTKELLDQAYDAAQTTGAPPKELFRYLQASQNWSRLLDQYTRERERLDRENRDREMSATWQEEADALAEDLMSRYQQYGPHYVLLCQVIAPLVVKLRKSYAGGIRLSPSEQTDLTRTVTQLIAQLQKHTESTKTEATITQEIAARVLSVIEHRLSNQPQLWQSIISEVKELVGTPAGVLTAGGS